MASGMDRCAVDAIYGESIRLIMMDGRTDRALFIDLFIETLLQVRSPPQLCWIES